MGLEEEHVPNGDRFVISYRIHRFLFGAGVDTVRMEIVAPAAQRLLRATARRTSLGLGH
jgi:hypothetical protein